MKTALLITAALILLPALAAAECRAVGTSRFHCDPPPRLPSFSPGRWAPKPAPARPFKYELESRSLPGGTQTWKYSDSLGRRWTGERYQSSYGRTVERGRIAP